MNTSTKNRFGKILMSLGVACLTSASSLLAQSYDNSFSFDLTRAGAPVGPVYLPDSTEIDCPVDSGGGDGRTFDGDDKTPPGGGDGQSWIDTGGALSFSVYNLPPGTYDISISGGGEYSGAMTYAVSSGDNTYSGDGTTFELVVTEGEPLNVTATAGYAIAYLSNISFYGPKGPDE